MFPVFDLPLTLAISTVLAAYLLGSIPFGMVIARFMGLGNLRDIGSGNIGATNVLRTGNKLAAFLTLLFDSGKGGAAVLIAGTIYGETAAQLAGLCAFLGHLFPIWLRFKGGKGVATFLGLLLALNFVAGFAACMTWLAGAAILRISSAAALAAAASAPVWLAIFGAQHTVGLAILLAVLVWIKHHSNIRRIFNGTEPKIGAGK
ncbi:MAG: glycerol-3-phosphate 1-O-acyltransferase PlsY [Rhodobacteraceae bacterium]|nr:glycerol-3-phosphate 1-O-acyltransferase PlsY [Paracoccaceae bacterium]